MTCRSSHASITWVGMPSFTMALASAIAVSTFVGGGAALAGAMPRTSVARQGIAWRKMDIGLQNNDKFMNIKLLKIRRLLFAICKHYSPKMLVSTPFLVILLMGLSGPSEDIQWAPLCGRLS
ncbi:MAG TPA: hypothetical protein VFH71_03325 [Rhodanobacteraceae bacterium]|nr:hypothetical protein [Rhodanobacteraceae bacterium]